MICAIAVIARFEARPSLSGCNRNRSLPSVIRWAYWPYRS